MEFLTLVFLVVAGAVVLGMIFSPGFRDRVLQTLRIKSNQALDQATTALDREKDEYQQLVAKLPVQRQAVTSVMANAALAKKELDRKMAELDQLKVDYKEAKELKASDAALNDLATKFSETETQVADQKKLVEDADKATVEARSTLESTLKAMQKFQQRIHTDESKAAQTAAWKVLDAARQQADDVQSSLSKAGEASQQIDKAYEEARAGAELSKGSQTDQELARLREEAAAKAAREKLDADMSGVESK